jgi:hypothetical protein
MRKKRNAYTVLVGNPKEIDHLIDLGVDGSIILKRILNRMEVHRVDSTRNQ